MGSMKIHVNKTKLCLSYKITLLRPKFIMKQDTKKGITYFTVFQALYMN